MKHNKREDEWSKFQGKFHDLKIKENTKKANNQSLYTLNILKQDKFWNEPATSVAELNEILLDKGDISEKLISS